MRRFIALVAAAAVLTLALAPGAAARTTRLAITGAETLSEVIVAGTTTMSGSVVSGRGIVYRYAVTGDDLIAGVDMVLVNYDLDTATGSGALWGKNSFEPTAHADGRFDCSWVGTFESFVWTGRAVCHGGGSLDGWQLRLGIVAEPGGLADELGGIAFVPGT